MRFLVSRALLVLALLSPAYTRDSQHHLDTVEDVLSENKGGPKDAGAAAGATNSEAVSDESTTFNRVTVPPMKELSGDEFDQEVKDGYWYASRGKASTVPSGGLLTYVNPGLSSTIRPIAITV